MVALNRDVDIEQLFKHSERKSSSSEFMSPLRADSKLPLNSASSPNGLPDTPPYFLKQIPLEEGPDKL